MSNNQFTLDRAREAVKLKNYANALKNYENFFEQTFNTSYYGVRLSYCLSEWKELADIYPDAMISLQNKRDKALQLLNKTKEPEQFHDYKSICDVLDSPEKALKEFLRLHTEDRALSTKIVRFIWDELIRKEEWKICLEYLDSPLKKYELYFDNFDTIFRKHVHDDSTDNDKEIFTHILNWYIKEVTNILLVLKHNHKMADYSLIRKRISSDLESRGLSKVEILIDRKLDNQ